MTEPAARSAINMIISKKIRLANPYCGDESVRNTTAHGIKKMTSISNRMKIIAMR